VKLKISIHVLLVAFTLTVARAAASLENFDATTEVVGRNTSGFETPVNQLVTPAGTLIELPGMRPLALALSPDGKLLVTAGLTREVVVVDPATGKILQRVSLPSNQAQEPVAVSTAIRSPDEKAQVSFTGLVFSPDGSRIYLSNVNGDIKVFGVQPGHKVVPLISIPLPPANAPLRTSEIPAGIAVSPDGKKIYVALNLSNRLAELDAATGRVLRIWDVGVAPYDVALAGRKIYVSNWGGRRPDADSVTGPAGDGTRVRVDSRSIASEGSVSVINLVDATPRRNDVDVTPSSRKSDGDGASPPQTELLTGLHAGALALSPNGRWLVVANTGSDTLSVIDTRTDQIVETVCARQNPGDLFGAQPNALAFDKSGKTLFVCNGTQNAVAVFRFKPGESKLLGLIPVGWFPGAIAFDASRKEIYVANIKSLGRGGLDKSSQTRFYSKQYAGSLSLVPLPAKRELAAFTQTALAGLRYPLLAQARLPARTNQPTRPVPERVGEPGVFQHVVYIIKENRTYDQVLGDVKEGNGNADLCTFGGRVTPNQHKLARDFVLLDNTYCCGILSADGHQWADTALATDYVEREFADWPRSYPSGGSGLDTRDALAYSPAGFIWNNALAHGKTLRDYGEFATAVTRWKNSAHKDKPHFTDCYHEFLNGTDNLAIGCEPDIESLRPYLATNTVGWNLDVPDVFRAAQFIKELKQFEADGNFPNFIIIWLPNDHTSGVKFGSPTPAAQMADNDLAFGRIVEAVSHSRFWTNTCIFAIEDDPQSGWDHVSGYRTTAYVVSTYTKRGAVVKTQYNQTSLLRTMELMLGLPPMNQMDATATPMFDCFIPPGAEPDFTPFDAVTNNVPLDEMNLLPKFISDPLLRKDAYASARLPFDKEDQCPEDLFNRILWRATKGSQTPYPVWAVKAVDDD
jgi:YVTN family beta-propeller protein